MAVRSLSELSKVLVNDPNLQQEFKADPVKAILHVIQGVEVPDTWVYRLVIAFLGATVLIVVVGGFIFVGKCGKDIPSALVAIGSAAVGALAGLLAPSPVTKP